MLGKLLKYELLHSMRRMLPFYIGCLLISFLFPLFDESMIAGILFDNIIFQILIPLLTVFFFVGMLVANVIIIISRFNKNCFSTEGYLTFTLPATKLQILLTKLISALILTAGTFLVYLFSMVFPIAIKMRDAFEFFTKLFRIQWDWAALSSLLLAVISFGVLAISTAYVILTITNSKKFIRVSWLSNLVLTLVFLVGYNVSFNFFGGPAFRHIFLNVSKTIQNYTGIEAFMHFQRAFAYFNLSMSGVNFAFSLVLLGITLYFLEHHLNIEGNE